MKKTFRTMLVALVAMAMVAFVGCDKEDDGSNSGNGNGTEQPTPTPNPNPNPQPTGNWIDLGLPSGLLWAECNVGANTPEGYGDYFAWGETTTKTVFDWSTYAYCTVHSNGDLDSLTKYNTLPTYGTVDNLTVLETVDDAATVNMGTGARTPTKAEWEELIDNTTSVWTTQNGVSGYRFEGENGNSIFLPAAGYHKDSDPYFVGEYGYYTSATLNGENPPFIWSFYCYSSTYGMVDYYNSRSTGLSVRAVRAAQK